MAHPCDVGAARRLQAGEEAVDSDPAWRTHVDATRGRVAEATLENQHGGQESTILALNNVFYHWGCLIVAPSYRDPLLYEAGGNPYGTSWGGSDGRPSPAVLAAARFQGRLLHDVAARLAPAPAATAS